MNRCILFLLLLPFSGFSQNWTPIQPSDIYNYQEATANYITTSIRIDSFTVEQTDTIYHFNRIVKDCEGCSFALEDSVLLVNQEDFLNRSMVQQENGMFVFSGNTSFQINPYANLNDTWIFDTANNVSANIIQIEETTIFDQTDSCKFILLSTNDTIKLSKNFGILEFNYQDKHYSLTGIQTRELGEIIPNWIGFHDFEVGDVFQYRFYNQSLSYISEGINKYTVLNKIENNEQIIYTYHVVRSESNQNGFMFWDVHTESTFDAPLNKDRPFEFFGNFNNQLSYWVEWESFGCEYFDDGKSLVRPLKLYKDQTSERVTLATGNLALDPEAYQEQIYLQTEESDSISQGYCIEDFYYVYTTGLGQTYYTATVLDNHNSKILIGYIKDGDTTGVITPDPILLNTNESLDSELTNFEVHPNPAYKVASIYFKSETPKTVEILDLNGRLVKEVILSNHVEMVDIQLDNLASGLYLVKAKYEQFERVQKMVKR